MTVKLTPQAASTVVDAVIREQLCAAWQRGIDAPPHSMSALTDIDARKSFQDIRDAVDDLTASVVSLWRDKLGCPDSGQGVNGDFISAADTQEPATEVLTVDAPDQVVVIAHHGLYLFDPGHRIRAGKCLTCRQPIGDQAAVLVTVVSFAQELCDCSCVEGDTFLMHAGHLPMPRETLTAAVSRALHCNANR